MITIFNRKELYLTSSLDLLTKIRNLLEENSIKYKINMRYSSGAAANGGAVTYLIYIYVHKNDYDKAQLLMTAAL